MKTKIIYVRIPEELAKRLEKIAKIRYTTKSSLIRDIVINFFEEVENKN